MGTFFRLFNKKIRRRFCRFYSNGLQANPSNCGKIYSETPETLDDLINYLNKNVIFRDDQLIACSKPFGVRIMSSNDSLEKTHQNPHGDRQILATAPTVLNAVPALSKEWKAPELRLAKFQVPLQMSGLVIFTLNEKSAKLFYKSCSRSMTSKTPMFHGWSICVGTPHPSFARETFCIRRQELSDGNRIYVPEKGADRISKNQILNRKIRRGTIEHEVLHAEKEFSLVSFASNTLTSHFVRVYLTYKGAPILGDAYYQQRITRIFGHPALVDPEKASTKNQFIPLDVLKRLNLSVKDYHQLPQYCHINRVVLLKFDDQKKDLVIDVNPPDYFLSAINSLGISKEILIKSKLEN